MMKNHMPKKKWFFLIVDIDYAGVSSGHKTVRSEITTINNDVWFYLDEVLCAGMASLILGVLSESKPYVSSIFFPSSVHRSSNQTER